MNASLEWIKQYVEGLDCSAEEYKDAVTLTGTMVEGYESLGEDLDKIVVGRIEKIDRHPDADKLIVCQLNIGKDELLQIVTGAPNLKEKDIVPVVLDGGKVACDHDGNRVKGGVKIKKGKLRGVESFGMMCSVEELGSSRDMFPDAPEDGVYVFNPDKAPALGSNAVEALGLDDVIFEHEITSNRVDCYGVVGIAREVAATFNKEFVYPPVECKGNDEKASDYIKVTTEDTKLCRRYCARVVKNLKIEPSPKWMQRRLSSQGIRPINNIVDITNYIMAEFGQPMHAFDLDTVAGAQIIVKRAKDGDKFVTLDGQERNLDSDVLMICDGEKPIGIAGIMGGENSMITDSAKTLLFEAACFDGTNIRLSSKRIGLRTDASSKFEKGLDPNLTLEALNSACQLIEYLGAGEVVGGVVDVYNDVATESRVKLEPDKINGLLGTDISKEDMISYMKRVDLQYDEKTGEIVAPSWRQDIHESADLAEEVARFYGYDKIPTTLPKGEATMGGISFKMKVEKTARDVAEYCGFSQGMTYSFESPKVFDKLLIPEDHDLRKVVSILNPLGEDYSVMRTQPLHGILTSLSNNYNRRNKDVRLYELANIYLPGDKEGVDLDAIKKKFGTTDVLPNERMQFVLGFYGQGDFFTMKGVIEEFFEKVGMTGKITYNPEIDRPYLHPGRKADVCYKGKVVGYLGEVHPLVCKNYEIGEKTYIGVVDMPAMMDFVNYTRRYEGIPKFPAVTRDISMIIPKDVMVGTIEDIIAKKGGGHLESYSLFDIYEGSQIKEGFKSVAYTITFRGKEKTLEEGDISKPMDKIYAALEEIGVELRK